METIFDHNPTPEELRAIGCDWWPQEQYVTRTGESDAWFELALLFRERGDAKNETRAWSHIPERRDEYLRGFDCIDLED